MKRYNLAKRLRHPNMDEKICRYPVETLGCEIKNSLQHLYGLAKAVDTKVEALLQTLGTTQNLSANNSMSNADIETALGTLMSNDIPKEECAFFVNPLIYADLMNSKAFIAAPNSPANYATSGALGNVVPTGFADNSVMATGNVGMLFGIPVYTSSIIATSATGGTEVGYLVHKSAIAVAVQQNIRVSELPSA